MVSFTNATVRLVVLYSSTTPVGEGFTWAKYPTLENNFPSVSQSPILLCAFVHLSVCHVSDPPTYVRLSVGHVFDPPAYVGLSVCPFVTFSTLAEKSMHSMLIL